MLKRKKKDVAKKVEPEAKPEPRFRPKVPDSVALQGAIINRQVICGCGCGDPVTMEDVEREHDPPLQSRKYDAATKKYDPDANDPRFIKLWKSACHKNKTHGPGGTKRITTRGGDNHTEKRTVGMNSKHAEHMRKMQMKTFGRVID